MRVNSKDELVIILPYSMSKVEIKRIKVPTLFPDDLPILNIETNYNNIFKDYKIDLSRSLHDEMLEPIFEDVNLFNSLERVKRTRRLKHYGLFLQNKNKLKYIFQIRT